MNKAFFIKRFSSKLNVTFIGLGNMGYSMGSNLAKSGKYVISGYDINKSVQDKFNTQENTKSEDFETSCKKADFIMTMLPNTDIVKSTFTQIANYSPKASTQFIDSSTICPIESKNISNSLISKGFNSADAPVSGGVVGATNATLTFMIGTNPDRYEIIKEFLASMGKNFFNCGDIGTGQIAKICNNLVLGITTAAVSESVTLGSKLGIDEKTLCKIMSVSSAYCWSLNVNSPVAGVLGTAPSDRNYEKGFGTSLMLKDMKLAKEAAELSNVNIELGRKSLEYYKNINDEGKGTKDFSYVYQYLKNKH